MLTASDHNRAFSRRVDSVQSQNNGELGREGSRVTRRRVVDRRDAYQYALKVAYLNYLLQPRRTRKEHVPAPPKSATGSATVMQEALREWEKLGNSGKGTRLPRDFMKRLLERMQRVLVGTEPRQEYKDPVVKRSFAAALNYFMGDSFQSSVDKDRRPDALVLMFYSKATIELKKGKAPTDDSWKMLGDRHLALFVRLMSLVMKDNDWTRERPELANRLTTLESKMLANEQDLSEDTSNGTLIDVVVPLSYHVKDMHAVQTVAKVFEVPLEDVQAELDQQKDSWTLAAALKDIKTYQQLLNLNSRKTLTSDDFDLESAYVAWKKAEAPELSQIMFTIFQADPTLAKHASGAQHGHSASTASNIPLVDRSSYEHPDQTQYAIDYQNPPDLSLISPTYERPPTGQDESEHPFTFIPPDKRAYYRTVLSCVTSYELKQAQAPVGEDAQPISEVSNLFAKPGIELLNEICKIWRIPYVSRVVLFMDVIREQFMDGAASIDVLDRAFLCLREGIPDTHKDQTLASLALSDRTQWPLSDFSLIQQILVAVHEALLRDLYSAAMQAYDSKPPSDLGPLMYILDSHIYDDPSFPRGASELRAFTEQLVNGLKDKASSMYRDLFAKELPKDHDTWEFYHIIQLGKGVISLSTKIQKRYRKNPEILGANPVSILVEVMLPEYAIDARDVVAHILELARYRGEQVPIEDGFDLYKELVDIRRIHTESVPGVDFAFEIEDLLADFVWRWIRLTEQSMPGWVENAVKQDEFTVRSEPGAIPTEEQRHSVSILDIFSSFNQSIEKIVGLNWDNDLHYAKFMTAIAKIMGSSLARYCEIVEQKFTREMDRLTPEQEAAANRTRQEKWMQAAKDAWSNKEKVEPFQFFTESFVKLNNVDYASRQLDRLEKEINVDACVDVIERNTPKPTGRQRKTTNYVFTIKIVEAEDLKACDISGLSDPYVVLGDEYQKRLAKTRIIYQNLNPRWDEAVDITTQGPLNVVATVWDWDQLGDHDCVGRTSIKLDPNHFGDFVPREYWLDLDTQGRLLLRVSMEGERDDIQFYFGKAFRTLKRTERDMTRIITDKLSSYINHCLSRRALRSLLNRGINLTTVTNYFNRNRPQPTSIMPTGPEIAEALKPLFTYFDDNFAIMNQTLTNNAMITVMTRLWKEVLSTIEALVVPALSDKPSQQRQLNEQELEVVFKWLKLLFDFFHAVDEETGEANGVPLDVLRSPKYFDIMSLNFFYFEPTDALIRESERMASATAARQQQTRANMNRLSAPSPGSLNLGGSGANSFLASRSRKTKSVMLSRNLGTMKKAKEDKRKEAQADPSDDMILRILRMRPEAEKYLKDRSRQKERLAAAAAAELIVKQSLAAGGGRMIGSLPRR